MFIKMKKKQNAINLIKTCSGKITVLFFVIGFILAFIIFPVIIQSHAEHDHENIIICPQTQMPGCQCEDTATNALIYQQPDFNERSHIDCSVCTFITKIDQLRHSFITYADSTNLNTVITISVILSVLMLIIITETPVDKKTQNNN